MKLLLCATALVLLGTVWAGQKCTGHPRMYHGKKCASTTHYADYHKGACGCGPSNGDSQVWWNHKLYTAAANQHLFDSGNKGWCGGNCGRCVRLTTTGGFVDGQGGGRPEGEVHSFMITNLCPNEYPNLSWCNQVQGRDNQYGYGWHFDLENGDGQIDRLGWSNPEVTWEFSDCDWSRGKDQMTPANGWYRTDCQCAHNGKREAEEGNCTVPIV